MTTIALDVLGNLRLPVGAIRPRKRAVLRATMPEASVDENRDFSTREYEIGADPAPLTRLDREVDSIPEAGSVSGFPNRLLGTSVAATIGAHDPASSFGNISPATGIRRPILL